jgi:outer membrane protein assembly factor BamD (BamD/ComL family)
MKTLALIGGACAAALVFMASCASGPVVIPPNLTAAEIFQRAQDASDRGDYPLGIRYYSMIQDTHPDDITHLTWAAYEIAFLYHKMGKDETALSQISDLLAKYTSGGDTLPPAPRILALKLKTRLEATAPKKP